MEKDKNKIIASGGKVLRRISDGMIAGSEVSLGYTYYLNGKKLDEPLLELPEHYEEIDEPVISEFQPLTVDADSVIVEVMAEEEEKPAEEEPEVQDEPVTEEPEPKPRIVITGQDFINMQEKLDKIMAILSPEQLEELQPSGNKAE